MMIKVTTKTKKAFMILAAVERGLFKDNVEASKVSNDNLYKMIKEWDAQHEQEQQGSEQEQAGAKPEAKTEGVVSGDSNKADGKKRRLPKRSTKMESADGNGKDTPSVKPEAKTEKVAEQVEVIEYKDIRTFRYLMLKLIREKYNVNYAKVQFAKIPKKHYSHAIELLNESISNAMTVLGKVLKAEIVIHLVDKDGNVTDGAVLVSRAKLAETRIELEALDKANGGKAEADKENLSREHNSKQESDPKADEQATAVERDAEDKKTADMIIASFNVLKIELDQAHKDNDELKAKVRKLEGEVSNKTRREVTIHDELVNFMNKIANTKDEKYVWVWKELNTFVSTKLARTEESPIVLDIEKLIIEESIRMREETDARRILEEKKARALENDTIYEGDHISYINSDVVKPKGVKNKTFKEYMVWYDECVEWVDYVIGKLKEFNSIVIKKKYKDAVDGLISELDEWYQSGWYDADCDDEIVDMVADIMIELAHSGKGEDFNYARDKALSNLVAVVDGLELV